MRSGMKDRAEWRACTEVLQKRVENPPKKNVVFKIWKMMMNQSKSHWILGTSYFQTKPRWSEVRTIATKLVTEHATT